MSEHGPVAETADGPVRGVDEGSLRVWKGIRYGRADRWRAPEAAGPWPGIADAISFGPVCPQPASRSIVFAPGTRFDEDCLSLNVWAASTVGAGDALPVVVWVHGGGFMLGAGSQPHFHGGALAGSGEIVLVTLNYRLGPFGFLDLSASGRGDTNLGLRDVLLALQWVQANIAAFGGDPGRVTLAGHSAGAGLVTALMAAPAAAGLFGRAIAQSGPVTSVYPPAHAARVAEHLGAAVGADLPDAPADALVAAGARAFLEIPRGAPGTLAFAPTVDGDILPEHPVAALRAGRAPAVPLLIGCTADEVSMLRFAGESALIPSTREQVRAMLAGMEAALPGRALPPEAQTTIAYAGRSRRAAREATGRDLAFRMPAVWLAEAHGAHASVHLYRFDWAPRAQHLLGIHARHGAELRYLWGEVEHYPLDPSFKLGGLRAGRALSRRMRARWRAFAATGGPGWPRYDPAAARVSLVIDRDDRVEHDLDAPLRAAWGAEPLTFC